MKVAGIIAEYNPFHNGHKYHINETKRLTGADYVVVVMSGNFVQRGAPALMDKYSRTRMALNNGADLVLELPVCYSTASAEYFALGSVALLDGLGVVDDLCFGSECGDVNLLKEAAAFLRNTTEWEEHLSEYLKQGHTFPAARAKAIARLRGSSPASRSIDGQDPLSAVLSEPNNILGVEYIKALQYLSSDIRPVTITRYASHYHDSELGDSGHSISSITQSETISSATAIRRALLPGQESLPEIIKSSIPADVYELMLHQFQKTYPIDEQDFSEIIRYLVLTQDRDSLTQYVDITPDLADRILKYNISYGYLNDFIKELKTKNLTHTRINRALFHSLLGIRKDSFQEYLKHSPAFYGRILGFRQESSPLIRTISEEGKLPLISRINPGKMQLSPLGQSMLEQDILAAHIYNQAVYHKFSTALENEYKCGVLRV